MRRNMSGNLGLYKYLWPGSVYVSPNNVTNFERDRKLCRVREYISKFFIANTM